MVCLDGKSFWALESGTDWHSGPERKSEVHQEYSSGFHSTHSIAAAFSK
jgi:hypothetical protein